MSELTEEQIEIGAKLYWNNMRQQDEFGKYNFNGAKMPDEIFEELRIRLRQLNEERNRLNRIYRYQTGNDFI